MDFIELDNYLRSYTEKEKINKLKISKPASPSSINYFEKRVDQESFVISKQDRFREVGLHSHSYIEIAYIYSGSCTQIINDEKIHLKEGELYILDTDMMHYIFQTSENDIIINILMDKKYFTTSLMSHCTNRGIISDFLVNAIAKNSNHNHYILFHSKDNEKLKLLIKLLLCEYFDESLYSSQSIESYMTLIFSELVRSYQYETNYTKATKESNLISILQHIEKNVKSCTLDSTAKEFGFHPNYLSTLLKKSTGYSFKELVQTQKLSYASFLLTNTNKPIDDICHEIGYNNTGFFYKKFREINGLTPAEFRIKHSKKSE